MAVTRSLKSLLIVTITQIIAILAKLQSNEGGEVIYTIPHIITNEEKTNRHKRDGEDCAKHISIILSTSDMDITLLLTTTEQLITPWANIERQKHDVTIAEPFRYHECLYQGKVEGDDKSYAAITTGYGVVGMYGYHGDQYNITPATTGLPQSDKDSLDSDTGLHVISKVNTKTGYESLLDESFSTHNSTRTKRQASTDKYLEVMVVVDNTIVDFHGGDKTELFILALFNMVNLVYSHNSLGVTIRLSLVKIVLLDEETAEEMWEGNDPRITLDRFCIWSAANSLREQEIGHFDFSMYLSRDRMSPAGYAPVTGMCRTDRSCALIKEEGFSTAFVAAHEIAHTIGLSHDGEGTNKCVNEPQRGSVMAPLVMANLHNYFWSPCSKEEINDIISSLYCLNDSPFDYNWSELLMPLGTNYDMDEQCRKEFGEGFQLCSRLTHNFNPCEHLWCSTPDNRYLCKTKKAPPLPGSECAEDRWCYNEQCIVASPDDIGWMSTDTETAGSFTSGTVDGSWSHWTSWSKCSTSCGQGIKSRTRTCDSPQPRLGGRDCEGESYELRICDLPEQMRLVCKMFYTLSYSVRRSCMKHQVYYRTCNKDVDDSRAEQCSRYNKRGRTYMPFEPEDENDLCTLNCKTEEESIPLYGSIEARDGTFCSYDDRTNVCYAGQCIPMSCDGKLGSLQSEDLCGVCEGDNSNCTLRQDYYNERLDRGYQLLVRLYPGTRHFRIKKPDDAFRLVLLNVKTNASILPDDTGDYFSIVDHGTLWKYSNERSQTLETVGPLQTEYDIIIYSMYSGLRATLSVSFTEPLDIKRDNDYREENNQNALVQEPVVERESRRSRYEWNSKGWSNCSQPCGSGWQRELFSCMNTVTRRTVPEGLCNSDLKPKPSRQPCNLRECNNQFRWVTSDWMHCPEIICNTDGDVQQRRWAFCVKENPSVGTTWHRVDDSLCNAGQKPELHRACNKSHCTVEGYWKTGSWSECSVTCGRGEQYRNVTCLPISSSSLRQAICSEDKPSVVEECSRRPCIEAISALGRHETSPEPNSGVNTTTLSRSERDEILRNGQTSIEEHMTTIGTQPLDTTTPIPVVNRKTEVNKGYKISPTKSVTPPSALPELTTANNITSLQLLTSKQTTFSDGNYMSSTQTSHHVSTSLPNRFPDPITTTYSYDITTQPTTNRESTNSPATIQQLDQLKAITTSHSLSEQVGQFGESSPSSPTRVTGENGLERTSDDYYSQSTAEPNSKFYTTASSSETKLIANSETSTLRDVETTTTMVANNEIVRNRSALRCTMDRSGICELMNERKCQLKLFRKLCCKTCANHIL